MTGDFRKESYWKLVEEFITELKTAKYWFKNDGNPLPEWKLFETWNAARDASRDAARDASRDAVWDAARDAAWNAAGDASLTNAARAAVWNAAWNAARAATWDATRDAAVFARMIVCVGLKIETKHLRHVNARMRVWRKGYGLYCDVNGVLYVYKKP